MRPRRYWHFTEFSEKIDSAAANETHGIPYKKVFFSVSYRLVSAFSSAALLVGETQIWPRFCDVERAVRSRTRVRTCTRRHSSDFFSPSSPGSLCSFGLNLLPSEAFSRCQPDRYLGSVIFEYSIRISSAPSSRLELSPITCPPARRTG